MRSFSIKEWCSLHGFSVSYFHLMASRNEGPRTFKSGRLTRISEEANAAWIAEREAASQGVAA